MHCSEKACTARCMPCLDPHHKSTCCRGGILPKRESPPPPQSCPLPACPLRTEDGTLQHRKRCESLSWLVVGDDLGAPPPPSQAIRAAVLAHQASNTPSAPASTSLLLLKPIASPNNSSSRNPQCTSQANRHGTPSFGIHPALSSIIIVAEEHPTRPGKQSTQTCRRARTGPRRWRPSTSWRRRVSSARHPCIYAACDGLGRIME